MRIMRSGAREISPLGQVLYRQVLYRQACHRAHRHATPPSVVATAAPCAVLPRARREFVHCRGENGGERVRPGSLLQPVVTAVTA